MEVVNKRLDRSENFTFTSNLVQPINERSWKGFGQAPVGRKNGKVFVFDALANRLLYEIASDRKVSILARISDWVQGTMYKVYSVSNKSKYIYFVSDFNCSDIRIPEMHLNIRVKVFDNQHESVAISVAEGGDPVKELCLQIKSYLDLQCAQISWEEAGSLKEFVRQIQSTGSRLKINQGQVKVDGITLSFRLPEVVEVTNNQRTLNAKNDFEVFKANHKHRLAQESRVSELKIQGLELENLGIDDPGIRLLMGDPQKRTDYIDQLYQQELEALKLRKEKEQELIELRHELIREFLTLRLNEHTEIDDFKNYLSFVDDALSSASLMNLLNPQLVRNGFKQSKKKETPNDSNDSDNSSPDSDDGHPQEGPPNQGNDDWVPRRNRGQAKASHVRAD